MNNISFSKKFSPQHDNGERILYWRKGKPFANEATGYYLVTLNTGIVVSALWQNGKFSHDGNELEVIAYMKFPSPYKSD